MNLTVRLALVLVLALAGAGMSYVLLLHHHGEESTAQVCGGPESGCDTLVGSLLPRAVELLKGMRH